MKHFLIGFLVAVCLVFASCDSTPFTGYIVHKTWIKAHMDNEYPVEINKGGYVPVFHPVPVQHRHTPIKINSEFIIYVANKDEVRAINVDSITWFKTEICQKITFKY
jgi:hypothetical protein